MPRATTHRLRQIFGRLLFLNVSPVIRLGRTKALAPSDMPELPSIFDPRRVDDAFWQLPLESPWRLLGTLLKVLRRRVIVMGSLIGLCGVAGVISPLLVHKLISYVEIGTMPLVPALAAALSLCLLNVVEALAFQHYVYFAVTSTQLVMNGLNLRIYRQALALTRRSRLKTPVGDVVNYMGTDTDAVAEFVWITVEASYAAVLVVAVIALLFHFLGLATVAAVGVLAALTPVTRKLARKFIKLDDAIMKHRDERVSQISQVLSGIRIVKFFAWEEKILGEIRGIRKEEVGARRRLAVGRAVSVLVWVGANTLVSIAAFGAYIALGHTLDAATIFACLGLFGLLEYPFGNLTNFITGIAEAKVSAARIAGFLKEETLPVEERPPSPADQALGLTLSKMTARYADGEKDVLSGINLEIRPGESVAVVGPVGSGKSSLLLAMLGEIPVTGGQASWLGLEEGHAPRTAYVPQEAFVQNGSLKENIYFGEPETSFADLEAVLRACALEHDIAALPGGLATEIGEHGINLSGGQKQRVCLARALVARSGLALLDDPLSAVDARTEDYLVEQLLFGAMGHTTRVVVTHRLKHLVRFDRIVFIEGGAVTASGSYHKLLHGCPRFAGFVAETLREEALHAKTAPEVVPAKAASPTPAEKVRITEDEDRETGAVKLKVYLDYFRSLGGQGRVGALMLAGLLLATLVVTVLPIVQTSWLSVWTDSMAGKATDGTPFASLLRPFVHSEAWRDVAVYGGIGIVLLVTFFGQNLLWSLRGVEAGRALHDRAFKATLATTLRFFDSTPVGRILNRFSRDVDSVERSLPWSFENTVRSVFYTVSSVTVLLTIMPFMALVVAPVLVVFFKLQGAYRASAREAQRLTSITRSPRFAHFKETLHGLSVIRGFHKTSAFTDKFHKTLADNQRMFHAMISINRWFSIRVPLASAAVSCGVAIGIVLGARAGLLAAGTTGMVLIYAMRFWEHLNWSVRTFSDVESRMTSVERLSRYSQLTAEPLVTAPMALTSDAPWPTTGAIEFKNVTARYAEHLPDVLKDVSFHVPAGARVGVIGRTGSGKSTIFQVLFRFIESRSGEILIDGKPIAGIPLPRLRRALAVIPQDPTLFKGTLRQNLDRFAQHDDDALWRALERSHLSAFVRSLPSGLDAEVKENGMNFSQGQRQLFCLARALLVDAKVIVMDEATASVDVETDALIQETVRRECAGRTLLIIAHRLGTVHDCDLVLEMADGRLRQAFTPAAAQVERKAAVPMLDAQAFGEPSADFSGNRNGLTFLQSEQVVSHMMVAQAVMAGEPSA